MAPAPLGFHGHYFLYDSVKVLYVANQMTKNSVLALFSGLGFAVQPELLNEAPHWDSLRYVIGQVRCDAEFIGAFIEFRQEEMEHTVFEVLWFNAEPTEDDGEYWLRAKKYDKCFEDILEAHKIVRKK